MEYNEDVETENELEHLGIKRRSGRYPWGSGGDPFQRSKDFKVYYDRMKADGVKDKDIASHINALLKAQGFKETFSTTDLRAATSISTEVIRDQNIAEAKKLKYKYGSEMSNVAIAETMGTRESTVRGWLKASEGVKEGSLRATAEAIKGHLETKPFLDVGKGSHLHMGVAKTKFDTAVAMLKDEGFRVHNLKLPFANTGEMTNFKVLTKEGIEWAQARAALYAGKIKTIAVQSDDNGQTYTPIAKDNPVSLNLKRVDVKWKEDGGAEMDGVLELRRGVDDLSLGASKYAQVRVAVNGTHYLKGMAMYTDNLPDGVDVRFNTNKSKTGPESIAEGKLGAMKPMKMKDGKLDPDSPFGATTYFKNYKDKNGKDQTSALNIVSEEGKWDTWSKNLSSQMLSKQSVTLASAQLDKARTKREQELKDIMALTNPMVREKYLREYADAADAASVNLKAAKMDRQSSHVLLPMNSVRPHEIFAPNYKPGEKVVLIRHPHGGPFEIPELTVNNSNPKAKRIMGGAKDAVGIHWSVAEQLSGADFDGDAVVVIPNNSRRVKTQSSLGELKGFDPKMQYKIADDDTRTTRMTKDSTQREMGGISNLITDMSIKGAPNHEIARAVKHSMVVIDAEKHGLDYKRSAKDNNIKELKTTYQGKGNAGAATIISRASSQDRVPHQKARNSSTGGPPIDPKTGKKMFVPTGDTKVTKVTNKKTGEVSYVEEPKMTKGTKMQFVDDARRLLSGGDKNSPVTRDRGTPMERIYADHANSMKALANQARKEMVAIKGPRQSPAAKAYYVKEAASLDQKLRLAQRNAPLERRAQSVASDLAKARIDANPSIDKDDRKTIQYKAIEDARLITGAKKIKIGSKESPLTAREWEAIQSGAISSTKVREILANADMDRVRELATPRARTALTTGQMARAKQMASQGRSVTDIAELLDLPRSTVADNLENG